MPDTAPTEGPGGPSHAPVVVNFHGASGPAVPVSSAAQAPVASPSDPSKPEERIRYFQSEADRARAEAERARVELEALRAEHANAMAGTKAAVDAATQQAMEALRLIDRERAERLRAEALLQRPHLADYLHLLPLTSKPEELQQHLTTLETVHQKQQEKIRTELEAQLKAQTPAPPPPQGTTPNLAALYPPGTFGGNVGSGVLPGALNPAAPAPTASPSASTTTPEQIEQRLKDAMAEAFAKNDMSIYHRAMSEQIELANAYTRRQAGL